MKKQKLKLKHIFFGFHKGLENKFYEDLYRKSLPFVRAALVLALILYALFGFLDLFTLPYTKKICWIIRFFIICPLSLLLLILTFISFFKKHIQLLLSIEALFLGLGIVAMIFFNTINEFGFRYYYTGIILVLIWNYSFARIRFINATVISWTITICLLLVIIMNNILKSEAGFPLYLTTVSFFLISTNIIGMFANFTIEYYLRNDFLLRNRLTAANRLVEQEKKSKAAYFIKIAHEIKTPLTLISNYLEKYVERSEKSEELEIIKRNINKLHRDIINFLDVEKLERGQVFYNHDKIYSLSGILNEKVLLFQEISIKKNISIDSKIENNIFIKADIYAIDRIINNLIDNAIKYTNENGNIIISLQANSTEIIFKIRDNGIGISEEQKNNLFLPYHQIALNKRNIQGIGMGLNIVYHIVKSLNGNITFESELNKGTEFIITIKRYFPTQGDVIDEMKLSKPFNPIHGYKKIKDPEFEWNKDTILIIDDNIDMTHYLLNELSETYNVFIEFNGVKALEKIKIMPKPDIIISDIMMDDIDGYKFYETISKDERLDNIPFIFLTAKTSLKEKIEGLQKGAVDYICKPFDINELKAKINSIIELKKKQLKTGMKDAVRIISDKLYDQKNIEKDKWKSFNSKIDELKITDRQKDIILLLKEGFEYKEIADNLNLALRTVGNHIQRLFEKTGTKNKIGLIKFFFE